MVLCSKEVTLQHVQRFDVAIIFGNMMLFHCDTKMLMQDRAGV